MFNFQRPQGLIRAFMGLQNNTLRGMDEIIRPTLELGWLTKQATDQQLVQVSSAASAPGAGNNTRYPTVANSGLGIYLIDELYITSNGPVTSGNFTVYPTVNRTRGSAAFAMPFFPYGQYPFNAARVTDGLGLVSGIQFNPPLVMQNDFQFDDYLNLFQWNHTGSVGNLLSIMTFTFRLLPSNRG